MKIKRLLMLAIAMVMCLCMVFATTGCFGSDESDKSSSAESFESVPDSMSADQSDSADDEVKITLSETASVAEFESITLTPVIKGEGTAVWTSSAPEIATVENGTVYGVKAGEAIIKIAIGKAEATCKVSVTPTRYAHEIALTSKSVSISKGKESVVKASITFNGQPLETEGVVYAWTPVGNAADFAEITSNEDGSAVTVKGISVGAAQFDVTTTVRGYEVDERLTVNVLDNVVILDFTNDKLMVGDGLYALGLTLGSEETSRLEIGTANILVDGEMKGEAEITWTSADSSAVSVEDGVIIARKAGYTLLSGECVYGEKTLTAQIGVTVAKGSVTLENVGMVIETAVDKTIEIPEGVIGKVEKITVSGKTIYDGATEISGSSAAIIENSMPSEMKDLGEGKPVAMETEDIVYTMQADVYTLIIDTKEEFDKWQEIACNEAVKAGLCPEAAYRQYMSGYFVLGADIEYNGNYAVFTPFDYYWKLGNVGIDGVKYGDGGWNRPTSYGFKGVFDGKGHVIDGLSVSGKLNGFVVTLSDGIIENVAFTNAKVSEEASLIARAGTGIVRNVYVQYAEIKGGGEENVSTLFGSSDDAGRTIENLIVDVTSCNFGSEVKNVYVIGGGYGTFKNVAVIGEFDVNAGNKALITDVEVKGDNYLVHKNSYEELLADEIAMANFAALDPSIWSINENLVTFKRLFDADNVTPSITNEETEIMKGGSVILTSNIKYVRYSLDGEIEGVSINGNVLSVGENVTAETQITIVATSLVNGETATFTFTVKAAGSIYVIGTEIDMTSENVTVPASAGLGGLWDMSAQFITEDNGEYIPGGKGGEIRFSQNEVNAAGMINLNSPIVVKDGMNYIRVRLYVKTASAETATIRWNKSNNDTHYIGYKDIEIKANEWVNTYLAVTYFAVDGKIDGFKLGYVGQSISGIYIDDITIVTENYTMGDLIDMSSENVTTSALSIGGIWDMPAAFIGSGAEGYIDGGSGSELKLTLNNGNYNSGITLNLANPLTVSEQMKYICMRVYVKSSLSEVTLHFDNVNVTTTDNYWNKPANQATVAANQWVNIYLVINEYVNDGKISSIKILNRTIENVSGTEYYFDYITITDTIGTAINLNGAQVVYPAFGNGWCEGMTVKNSIIELSDGKPFACARIDFAQPYTVTSETKIVLKMKVSASLQGGFIAIFKHGEEGDDKWQEYRDYSIGEYATVEYDLSKFTEAGELKGISFGLFGSNEIAAGTTLYIESISVL